jgi:GNAT superfamily N-acetyltransferase
LQVGDAVPHDLHVALPGQDLPEAYFATRYEVLRRPLGRPPGSERLTDEHEALHVWVAVEGQIVAVGRAHLLLGDGAAADHAGLGAATIPAFEPLRGPNDAPLRPAVQIRQMGVLSSFQGRGYGALVLDHLERNASAHFHATTGWLQAREAAIGFYERCGWGVVGAWYDIEGVGRHRSMMKTFTPSS